MLYGRDEERARVAALLDAARASRSGVLVLRGEAGIGKTALLEDTREQADDMHVLAARGVEAELELPFAALDQLIRPTLGHLGHLPAPQAAALSAALGLEEGSGHERFLVFAACLSLLSELADQRPVLCLVDDAQWLDAGSADALRFVARRLDAEGIVILFAAREEGGHEFEAADLPSLRLGGLDDRAAATLLTGRAGVHPAASVRDLLVEQSRGNALALVELPSALSDGQLAGEVPLPDVLPVPRELERVFLERAEHLPDETARLLLVAAADDTQDVGVVTRAAETLGANPGALDAAEDAGLVDVRDRRLVFRHPLVRSAVYGAATSSERRAAHGALATALAEDEDHIDRRAWHLALSTIEHDDGVLRALDDAAERARERNGHIAAARALERAAELSSTPGDRSRRLARAAGNLSIAGRDEQAVLWAKTAAPDVDDPTLRAELAEVQGLAAIRRGRPGDVVALLVDAAREVASTDPAKAVELLMDAGVAVWMGGDQEQFLEVTCLAALVVPHAEDETGRHVASSLAVLAATMGGATSEGVRRLAEVVDWGATAGRSRHVLWASYVAFWIGDAPRFAALVNRAESMARERGELGVLTDALGMQAVRLVLEQRFDEASAVAVEAVQLSGELGADNLELLPRAMLAIVAAIRGEDDEARRYGEEVLERARANGLRLRASAAVYALAVIDMSRGRWSDAVARLDLLVGSEFGVAATIPDKIEAAVRAGRLDDARAALPILEARIDYVGDRAARPRLAACRALLADGELATSYFEEALALADAARPLDLARIRLLYGEHLRRNRRRADARVELRAAIEQFERLRAEPWAERARAELRATGETARKRDSSTVDQLTPQEMQVARLVAGGLSNKQVAAQLFLSPRTIDAHLRSVFAKLGLTSRTQLARLLLKTDGEP